MRRLGRTEEAGDAYRRAHALVHDDAERRLLERRLAELGTAGGLAPTPNRGFRPNSGKLFRARLQRS